MKIGPLHIFIERAAVVKINVERIRYREMQTIILFK